MRRFEQPSPATPAAAWALIAQPGRWPEWAPHIRGASGLGSPEVLAGRRGVVWVALVTPVPVHVEALVPGHFWDWRTGPLRIRHCVEPRADGGCVLAIELTAPAGLETVLALSYGPVIRYVLARLDRLAAAESPDGLAEPAR